MSSILSLSGIWIFIFISFLNAYQPINGHGCLINEVIDLTMVIDNSFYSIPEYFKYLKMFLKRTIKHLNVHPDHTRVRILQFSNPRASLSSFTENANRTSFAQLIDSMDLYYAETTFLLSSAISVAADLYSPGQGARQYSDKILVIITHTRNQEDLQAIGILSLLQNRNIRGYIVAIDQEQSLNNMWPYERIIYLGDEMELYNCYGMVEKFSEVYGCPTTECVEVDCPNTGYCDKGVCLCSDTNDGHRLCGPCDYAKCVNGGKCVRGKCVCVFEHEGPLCEFSPTPKTAAPRSPCSPDPCMPYRGCTCVESCQHSEGFYCHSNLGYIGKTCSIATPTLSCEPNRIEVSVSEDFVLEYHSGFSGNPVKSYIYIASQVDGLSNSFCKVNDPSNGAYHLSVVLPFSACGISTTVQDDLVSFSGKVWLNRQMGDIFDMPVPIFQFTCSYDTEYNIVTSLKPVVFTHKITKVTPRISKLQQFVDMELCKVASSCPSACPPLYTVDNGAVYTVSEMIHIRITSVQYSDDYWLQIEEFYLSCARTPGSVELELIHNGCESSVLSSRINAESVNDAVCVSFRVPRLTNCRDMYIHAQLLSVLRNTAPNTDKNCQNASENKRQRRSSGAYRISEQEVSLGPIVVIEGTAGWSKSDLFPYKTDFNNLKVSSNLSTFSTNLTTKSTDGANSKRPWLKIIPLLFGVIAFFVLIWFCLK